MRNFGLYEKVLELTGSKIYIKNFSQLCEEIEHSRADIFFANRLMTEMFMEGLLQKSDLADCEVKLTEFAIEVRQAGGFTKYFEQKKIEIKKLQNELTLSKWQLIVFWPSVLIGIVGGICGIISLFYD